MSVFTAADKEPLAHFGCPEVITEQVLTLLQPHGATLEHLTGIAAALGIDLAAPHLNWAALPALIAAVFANPFSLTGFITALGAFLGTAGAVDEVVRGVFARPTLNWAALPALIAASVARPFSLANWFAALQAFLG